MGTFRNVSKAEPCPICGKSDWCSILIPDNAAYPGQLLYVCRRIHSPEAQSPVNGKTYYYIPQPTAAIKPKSKKAKRIILFVDARAIMHIYGILYQINRELNSPASIHTKG